MGCWSCKACITCSGLITNLFAIDRKCTIVLAPLYTHTHIVNSHFPPLLLPSVTPMASLYNSSVGMQIRPFCVDDWVFCGLLYHALFIVCCPLLSVYMYLDPTHTNSNPEKLLYKDTLELRTPLWTRHFTSTPKCHICILYTPEMRTLSGSQVSWLKGVACICLYKVVHGC